MNLKITIPSDISDITLKQFQEYEELKELGDENIDSKIIEIFTGVDESLMGAIPKKEKESLISDVLKALDTDCDFKPIFKLDGVEFGFIPNLDEVTGDEFTDLTEYSKEPKYLHKLIAILFRPITKIDAFGNYLIKPDNGTAKYAETMKKTPMNIVNGCLGFFLTLYNDLEIPFLKFIVEEQARVQTL